MAQVQVFTGTWDELNAYTKAFRGKRNLTLIVPTEDTAPEVPVGQHFYMTATPEEFRRAFNALGEDNEELPGLPPEAFDRENLYDEDRF